MGILHAFGIEFGSVPHLHTKRQQCIYPSHTGVEYLSLDLKALGFC
jgi:hypothetical protein